MFRTAARDDLYSPATADYAYDYLGLRKAAVLDDKSAFGQSFAQLFAQRFKALGGSVVFQDSVNPADQDFSAVLTRIKGLSPDLLFYGGYYDAAGRMRSQMVNVGLNVAYGSTTDIVASGDKYLAIAGSAADGSFGTSGPTPQMLPAAKQMVDAYQSKYGAAPDEWSIHAYDATNIVLNAIQTANSTNHSAVTKAIAATHNYPGAFGAITFDSKGDITGYPMVAFLRKAGAWHEFIASDTQMSQWQAVAGT
jgi:branched-chain amino acid transport system substrate-binding protein